MLRLVRIDERDDNKADFHLNNGVILRGVDFSTIQVEDPSVGRRFQNGKPIPLTFSINYAALSHPATQRKPT